ncbi:MAG TPA: carbon starvation protein A [Acidobacteriota bacterium]|nr:carbon starvation protein A [Acidobacteriota bacterium]
MSTLLVALLSAVGFIVAYNTYGRYISRKIFGLSDENTVPSREMRDGVDYVPTRRWIVFGHHFTSIAGTGPIVGPAIAVFWGWLPALLWVLFGSIFIGAVHDLGALIVSIRSRGQTIGDVAGRMISPRSRILFLFILFLALAIVIGVFGLVIAVIFSVYPQTVLSVWASLPIAVALGFWLYKYNGRLMMPSLLALAVVYLMVYVGAYHVPVSLQDLLGIPLFGGPEAGFLGGLSSAVVLWTLILLVYCFVASTLPVWMLLQPRDFVNSHQLVVTLLLIMGALVVAHPEFVAPAVNSHAPGDAPPLFPFLFITIACGAVSGFHCLVSSGTSSKQIEKESDAPAIGYGSMLLEGGLAVLVIIACCAGIGMGVWTLEGGDFVPITDASGAALTGQAAWLQYYGGSWVSMSLVKKVGAFIEGGANMLGALGIPIKMGIALIAVMVACFAATTLDTATRLQRYVLQELGGSVSFLPVLKNKYTATTVAVVTGGALALVPGPSGPGSGGLILWPLFGAVNQLLAGLAFLVIAFYLIRHKKPIWILAVPGVLMVILPAWAMFHQIAGWYAEGNWLLFLIGIGVEILQAWMIWEGALMWSTAKGTLPDPLPPLTATPEGGRS